MRIFFLSVLLLFISVTSNATHIVGGEVHYEYLGANTYHIWVKVYRDCSPGTAAYDNPMPLGIFDSAGVIVTVIYFNLPPTVILPNDANNPCLTVIPDICVEEAIYEGTVVLPPLAGGYTLVYQRCCRNNSIDNLVDPGNTGATYTAHIPGPDYETNSDPLFDNFPPTVICGGYPLTFDHSATDIDGDSLVYSFCDPHLGATSTASTPDPPSPPPYTNVTFVSPYSYTNPMGGAPPLSIDPVTGILTGTPTNLGQYVVGVCVSEYRDGILLSEHRRDFQFNVAECVQLVQVIPQPNINQCNNLTVAFNDSSVGGFTYFWNFGTGVPGDTTNQNDPTFTYPALGMYTAMFVVNPYTMCSETTYVQVNLIDPTDYQVSPTTLIYLGQSTTIFGKTGISYQWSPDSTLSSNNVSAPIASPTVTTTYTVIITFDTGCIAIDSVVVLVDQNPLLIFPNAFTPNDDGLNDRFKPYHLGFIDVDIFRIFNRWGQLVYESNNLDGWDGKYKGKPQDVGTFAYYMVGTGSLTKKHLQYQGNFTLMR